MPQLIQIDGLAARVAVVKPTVVGAAVRVFLLGGSSLTDKEAGQACGSPYLFKENRDAILGLVSELERRKVSEPGVVANG